MRTQNTRVSDTVRHQTNNPLQVNEPPRPETSRKVIEVPEAQHMRAERNLAPPPRRTLGHTLKLQTHPAREASPEPNPPHATVVRMIVTESIRDALRQIQPTGDSVLNRQCVNTSEAKSLCRCLKHLPGDSEIRAGARHGSCHRPTPLPFSSVVCVLGFIPLPLSSLAGIPSREVKPCVEVGPRTGDSDEVVMRAPRRASVKYRKAIFKVCLKDGFPKFQALSLPTDSVRNRLGKCQRHEQQRLDA